MNIDELTAFTRTIYRGASKNLRFLVQDADGSKPDISTWSVMFTMRTTERAGDPPAINQSASIVPPGTNAELLVSLTRAQTLALTPGKTYVCSLFRTDSGYEELIGLGNILVKNDIYDQQV